MELQLFDTPETSVAKSKKYYKGAKGQFTSKVKSEVYQAKSELKRWKSIAEFYKKRCERYEQRIKTFQE